MKVDRIILEELPVSVQDHIKQLERVRQDFVANVSHELRTPLTVIMGYLETLIDKGATIDIETLEKAFQQMHQHSLRMESIIDDLLLLSRVEREENSFYEKENINISAVLSLIKADAQSFSGSKNHKILLNVNKSLYLSGSEKDLKSLFSNLIINAVKYTQANGTITINWYVENNQATFSVKDTGIGIAKAHLPRITERFYRVDKARSRSSGGTGLGLAIAKHVLIAHQAELLIESELNKGSKFTCIFPESRTYLEKNTD